MAGVGMAGVGSAGVGMSGSGSAGPPCPTCRRVVSPAPRRGTCDIMVDLRTLLNLSDNYALVGGWGPVIADVVRQLALDPDSIQRWMFTILDDHGRRLTQITTNRRPTNSQKRQVRSRDLTCKFPNCRKPADQCQLDHTTPYADHGITHPSNLADLCPAHHRLRTQLGLDYQITINGNAYWHLPDGRILFVPADGLPWYTGTDLDNAPPRTPINQHIPHRTPQPDHTKPHPLFQPEPA